MNDQKANIAVAEFCGFIDIVKDVPEDMYGTFGEFEMVPLPDYSSDLNALRDATKRLNERQKSIFLVWLHNTNRSESYEFSIAFAEAAQIREALLRTIGKWEDGE